MAANFFQKNFFFFKFDGFIVDVDVTSGQNYVSIFIYHLPDVEYVLPDVEYGQM